MKDVLVVGGAAGIGRATVERLRRGQYRVVVADADASRLAALSSDAPPGGSVRRLVMDIADRGQVANGLAAVGPLDAVVVTAGVHATCPIEHLPDDLIDRVLDVNLRSHIRFVRDVLPRLRDGGRIIGVSSIAAGLGVPMSSLYSASKAGLEAFYECLAVEMSYRRIHAVIVQPGNVNTGFNETGNVYQPRGATFVDEGYRRVVAGIHSSRGMDPDAVAATIVRAIEASSPPMCYVVGANARKAYWAKRLLGRGPALRLMARYFGL